MCDCSNKSRRVISHERPPLNKQTPHITQLPRNFNWKIYKEINKDLSNIGIYTEQHIMGHWYTNGINENRVYCITQITLDPEWSKRK